MSKLIPSREELDYFVFLLRRFHDAESQSWTADRACPPTLEVATLWKAVCRVLQTQDFSAPFGWPEDVLYTLAELRSRLRTLAELRSQLPVHAPRGDEFLQLHLHSGLQLPVHTRQGDKFKLALDELDRLTGKLETAMPAELAVGNPATPLQHEFERQTVSTLRDRLELILAVFDEDNPGPLRGKKIAELSRLHYDAHFRADLSQLKSLGFLENNGQGYTRTDKPYPMS